MVGAYDQWAISNSGRKEALEAKRFGGKLKDRVDELSAMLSYTSKNISELMTTVAASKKVVDQETIKFIALKKGSSGGARVQVGCAPDWRAVLEEAEVGDTMGVS